MPTKGFYGYAAANPNAVCMVDDAGALTRGQVRERIYRAANGLRSLGLGKGDHICLLVSNRSEFLELVAASGISGTVFTPVNWHLKADEVAYVVDDCDASVLFCDVRFAETGLDAAKRASNLRTIVSVGGDIDGAVPLEEWLASQSPDDPPNQVSGGQMLYSSGTTGMPKGILRRPRFDDPDETLSAESRPTGGKIPAIIEGVWLVTGPLYHAAPLGFTNISFHRGNRIVIMDRWTPEETLDLIGEHRVTGLHLVPTMFSRLLALPEERKAAFDPSGLQLALHGAAPCPPSVKKGMIDWWGPVIHEYYGATEGGLTWVTSEEWLEHPGTVGTALPLWDVLAMDEQGNELPPGKTGTIYFRVKLGPTFEYYKSPENTAGAHLGKDMFTLGDVGHIDTEGFVYLTDRRADMIISGGVNVYPAEVENCLHAHPNIADVAVIGVPDDEWGESVKAVVQLADGMEPSDELASDIIAFARDRIASFKCPRSVDFVDQLPRTEAGKLYKRRLREQYWAAAGRSI